MSEHPDGPDETDKIMKRILDEHSGPPMNPLENPRLMAVRRWEEGMRARERAEHTPETPAEVTPVADEAEEYLRRHR